MDNSLFGLCSEDVSRTQGQAVGWSGTLLENLLLGEKWLKLVDEDARILGYVVCRCFVWDAHRGNEVLGEHLCEMIKDR